MHPGTASRITWDIFQLLQVSLVTPSRVHEITSEQTCPKTYLCEPLLDEGPCPPALASRARARASCRHSKSLRCSHMDQRHALGSTYNNSDSSLWLFSEWFASFKCIHSINFRVKTISKIRCSIGRSICISLSIEMCCKQRIVSIVHYSESSDHQYQACNGRSKLCSIMLAWLVWVNVWKYISHKTLF